MSIYAILNATSEAVPGSGPSMMTIEDATVWDGVRSGVFRVETHKLSDCGTLIELIADDALEAHEHLQDLPLVNSGQVSVELRGVVSEAVGHRIDCSHLAQLNLEPDVRTQLYALTA